MNTSEAVKRPIGLLLIVAVMAVMIFAVGERLRSSGDAYDVHGGGQYDHGVLNYVQEHSKIMHVPESAVPMDLLPQGDVKQRGLEGYYALRHYPGAPPRIPHEVTSSMDQVMSCNVCHQRGGFVAKYNAYAPLTPHPEYDNCMQCHVAGNGEGVFAETAFVSLAPPALKRPALPGGPIPIPHTLHLRENCLTCHAGPAAPPEIRTTHPERVHCQQCHVPSDGQKVFERVSLLSADVR
jgi:cytochrome c-type protein NapB